MESQLERELFAERERLRITLASIGDAVISTDPVGKVVYLNPVAELLTGWTQAEALGRPLPEVFKIINASTRREVENPALRALKDRQTVQLANHTLLIARNGAECPIGDSAAPMLDPSGATIGSVLIFRDLSERFRTEELQARLAAIVQGSEDAIISKTLDGVIRSWNPSAEALFGYTADEIIGQSILLLIPPERRDEETQIVSRLVRGERIDHFETVRVAKGGRRLDISLTVSPIKDHDGKVIGASKIARDIGVQVREAAQLRDREARARFLADLSSATQSLADADQVMATTTRSLAEFLDVNRCAYAEVERETTFVITGDFCRGVPSIVGRWPVAAFGAACEEAMRGNRAFVIDDVDADPRAGADLEAYRQTRIQAVICVPLHKAGKLAAAMAVHQATARHWTEAELELVRTVVGRSWETIERTRAARELASAAERLSMVLVAANLGDWARDDRSGLTTLSARAAEIFDLPRDEPVATPRIQATVHPDDRAIAVAAANQAVVDRGLYDIEYRIVRRDGAVTWVSAKGRGQYDPLTGVPSGTIGVIGDITERKRLEQELVRRNEELADADRKKDDFIALLAHELRNPLAPVRTGLQVLRLAAGDPALVAKTRATMDRQLSHMVRIIDDLLDVSRLNRNQLQIQRARILLSDAVNDAVEATDPTIQAARHSLVVKLPEAPVPLDADLTRLAQIFGNLLTNSAKYTPPGGTIWLTGALAGAEVVVTVRDSGNGIPAASLPRVFDMFAQVDRSGDRGGGLGIGLALVKGLVEGHGGTVSASSPGLGKGSTFTVRLPLPRESGADGASAGGTGPAAATQGLRILVADDNRDGASSMAELLELLGHQVHLAHDGVEAVEVAERVRPQLILMDIGMPRLNGLEATAKIREQSWGKAPTIIALTGWGQESDREKSRAAGCNGHLVKPIGIPALEKLLAELQPKG